MKHKVAPLLTAETRVHRVQGVRDVRPFIGSCNFYSTHIRHFTYCSVLLTNLKKKTGKWSSTKEQQDEFNELKEKLG